MPWLGIPEFMGALEKVTRDADAASKMIVHTGSMKLVREAKANFDGSHKKGQPHQGGDKPNVVTGTLRRSIRATPVEKTGLFEYSSSVGPTVVYGRAVELGYAPRNMRPFPYFNPAAEKVLPEIRDLAVNVWAGFLNL